MSNAGICHYKVGGTDGVSLEIDKWAQTLERMGHKVLLCGGDLGGREGFLLEELYHHREDIERITRNAFDCLTDYESGEDLKKDILSLADQIEQGLRSFVDDFSIDLLIPNNIWSIGVNLPAAVALARVVSDRGIPTIAHHHDFYWEAFRGMAPTCEAVRHIAQDCLPPSNPLVSHVVINSLVQAELRRNNDVESTVVPNVFDFAENSWSVDAYNRGFREAIEVGDNDIVILQATRIVERKGIELAIDLVKELGEPPNIAKLQQSRLYNGRQFDKDSRIVLVLAGYAEDKAGSYLARLKQKINRTGIDARFISEKILSRRMEIDGERLYSLWDSYVFADLATYPSLFEGWGNQFLEAIRAKLPIAVFEYPVYRSDIQCKGFDVVSLGSKLEGTDDLGLVRVSEKVLRQATEKSVEVLTDPSRRRAMVEHNFALGKQYYSLERLEQQLANIIARTERS